jgi:hypothetical protein
VAHWAMYLHWSEQIAERAWWGDAPSCRHSIVTSNGTPYVFRTSIENRHQSDSSSISKIDREHVAPAIECSDTSSVAESGNGMMSMP